MSLTPRSEDVVKLEPQLRRESWPDLHPVQVDRTELGPAAAQPNSGPAIKLEPEPDSSENSEEFQPLMAEKTDLEPAFKVGSREGSEESADEEQEQDGRRGRVERAVEQALCEWFADHPMFYDSADPNFKNRRLKERLLSRMGRELNMSGDQLTLWWKSQRTIYGRLAKGKGTSRITERQKWNLDNFHFLRPHISTRNKQQDQVLPVDTAEECYRPPSGPDVGVGSASADGDPSARLQCAERPSPAPKRQRRCSTVGGDNWARPTEAAPPLELAPPGRGARAAFCRWVEAETELLPDPLFRQLQTEVFAAVMKYHDMAANPGPDTSRDKSANPGHNTQPRQNSQPGP